VVLVTRQAFVLPVPGANRSRIALNAPFNFSKTHRIRRNLQSKRHSVATLVANPQQHRRKSARMAPQPYAAAMASHMIASGLGQMDWDFQ
jgi:hypothetical protein